MENEKITDENAAVTIWETASPQETFALGERIGQSCRPGELYVLTGDLGAGKTVFTQGVAKGLGIAEPVTSPTFTILQIYDGGRMPFYHFDVYRIGDISEMEEIGYEDCFYGEGVCMVEWGDLIRELLPEHYCRVTIEREPSKGLDCRRISVKRVSNCSQQGLLRRETLRVATQPSFTLGKMPDGIFHPDWRD